MTTALCGLGVFVRTFLHRDRWIIVWFTIGVAILYWSQAASVDRLYRNQAEFDRAAASMQDNPAFVAMTGPARALNTAGGQVAWQASAFGAICVALMVMFMIGRHTRAEEESGREELIRSAVVGRTAPMAAAYLVAAIASIIVGAGVSALLIAYGLAAPGSLALGVGVAMCGLAFGAIALAAAQLTSSTRAVYGITGAAIGTSYALRAIGDVGNGVVSWFSPIGWYQAMHAFSGERWWPAALLLAAAALGLAVAFRLFAARDIGAGLWAGRPGSARAGRGLHGSLGLAWRLQRGSLYGWSIGLFLGGMGYGSIGKDIKTVIGTSTFAKDVFGAGGIDIVDSFYASAALMLALITCGFTISSTLRPRGEENEARVEALLATAVPRPAWLGSHLAITVLGTLVVLALAGLGLGLGFALVTSDASRIGSFTGAVLTLAPGVLVLAAITCLLYGAVPRLAPLGWLVLVFCVVVMMFGAVLRFPQWLIEVSPFQHLASFPASPVDWGPAVVLLAVAAVVGAAGIAALSRRDVH